MYSWIENTFGVSDGLARGLAFAISLAVVLALFALFVFIIKRLAVGRVASVRNRQPRLAIMDSTHIDTRRRLVLIRRDNIEHLILVGGPSDVVVEQGIIRNTPLTVGHPRQQMALQNGNSPQMSGDSITANVVPPAQFTQDQQPGALPAAVPAEEEPPARVTAQALAQPAAQAPRPVPPAPEHSRPKSAVQSAAATFKNRLSELQRTSPIGGEKRAQAPAAPTPPKPSATVQTAPAAATAANTKAPAPAMDVAPAKEMTAPPVQPARPVQPAAAKGAAGKSTVTSFAQAATRPTQDRVAVSRPTMMTRAVSPPSSGPAAKALTAYPKGSPATKEKLAGNDAAAPAAEEVKDTAPAENTAETAPAKTAATTSKATAPAEKPVKAETPPAAAAVKGAETGAGKPGADNATETASEPKAKTTEEKPADKAEETVSAKEEVKSDQEATPEPADKAEEASPAAEKAESEDQEPAEAESSGEDKTDPDKTPELNPIEDEMAKLLDEVHGNKKE